MHAAALAATAQSSRLRYYFCCYFRAAAQRLPVQPAPSSIPPLWTAAHPVETCHPGPLRQRQFRSTLLAMQTIRSAVVPLLLLVLASIPASAAKVHTVTLGAAR